MTCDPMHRQAVALAWSSLEGLDPREMARLSGAKLSEGALVVPALGCDIVVELRDRTVTTPPELSGAWGLVTLHHLRGCAGWRKDDEWTSFEQLSEARPFADAFRQRAVTPLAMRFGNAPSELIRSGRRLGGRPLTMGDTAIVLQAFPRLTIAVVVWKGDGEIPPGANLLFNKGGAGTLPAEDLAEVGIAICQMLVSKDR
jgi:hypothetical protein